MSRIYRVFICVFFFCVGLCGQSTNHFYIMVDRSQSINPYEAQAAKVVLKDLLLGHQISDARFSIADAANSIGPGKPLVTTNSVLHFAEFGDRYVFKVHETKTIQNAQTDVEKYIGLYFPNSFNSGLTYYSLAMAKIAVDAANNGISNYRIAVVSDFRKDNGVMTQEEVDLVDSFEKKNTGGEKALLGKIFFNSHPEFSVKVFEWNIINWMSTVQSKSGRSNSPQGAQPTQAIISFTGIGGGKPNNPVTIENETVTISWSINPPVQPITYQLVVSGINGTTTRERFRTNMASYRVKLEDGQYRLTVSADKSDNQQMEIISASTYIEISSGDTTGWVIALLVLLAIAILVFLSRKNKLFFRTKKNPKVEEF